MFASRRGTDDKADELTDKQEKNRQRHMGEQTDPQAYKQTYKQTDKNPKKQVRQAGKQTDPQAEKQTYKYR